jgi:hypothetical protein
MILLENEVAGYAVLTFGYSLEFHGRDAFVWVGMACASSALISRRNLRRL